MGKLENFDIFDSYEHVVHYTHDTLEKMLSRNKFKLVNASIGRPIQVPVWHKYVGQYYQYSSSWVLDFKRHVARDIFYLLSLVEFRVRLNKIGYFAPNIIAIARKI